MIEISPGDLGQTSHLLRIEALDLRLFPRDKVDVGLFGFAGGVPLCAEADCNCAAEQREGTGADGQPDIHCGKFSSPAST